ncbi:MAG TPA: low specificity L-threonine aldolase [Dongiaceae bacterium]|jgi:threonine aldolase|nr:low specificity L-threonine aldolase [Dongiaceae bacterium]
MDFRSDNVAGVAPQIMEAVIAANEGTATSYGGDDISARVEARLCEMFEREVRAFPVATGTAANALSLAAMTPPYGAILCHEEAHIQLDECGAPEMFTGGAKLVPLPGASGKLTPDAVRGVLETTLSGDPHRVQPAALSLTQATEAGTCYRADEVGALAEVVRSRGMKVQMDGARFANAAAHLGLSPAEITWRAGVDVLAFGATKNGALGAEVVVFFDTTLAETFALRRKRAGHLFSKMRFVSAQLEAYLAEDRWLAFARHANAMAARIAQGLQRLPRVKLLHAVEANEVFAALPLPVIAGLRKAGFDFSDWGDAGPGVVRLVLAFNTDPAHVDAFIQMAGRLAAEAA